MQGVMKWKPRDNGFTKPLNVLQIFAWVVSAINLGYLAFATAMYFWIFTIISAAWYVATLLFVFRYAAETMLCNPIDEVVIQERKWKDMNVSFNRNDYEFFCVIWDTHVSNKSKHWGKWNKCISGFDHHCYWLNNWIGDK